MNRDRRKFRAYVTKFALTKGIEAIDAEDFGDIKPGMIADASHWRYVYYNRIDWHFTIEEAKERADKVRRSRVNKLRRTIAKLENIQF